jgi:hypothetical protein
MTNYGQIGSDCKQDIEESLTVDHVEYIAERITLIQKELSALSPLIDIRKNHIRDHIVRKYCVNVWKIKGVYRDTSDTFEKDSITKETTGSHYSVLVYEYIYDTSLIGTMSKDHYPQDRRVIDVPHLKGVDDGYNRGLSRQFSWKKKDLAFQYANKICREHGLTLKPSSEFSDIMNDECLFVTGHNDSGSVWRDS